MTLPKIEVSRLRPYDVREVQVSETTAAALPFYGPYYNVFDKDGRAVFKQPMTWSDAAHAAAEMNEA